MAVGQPLNYNLQLDNPMSNSKINQALSYLNALLHEELLDLATEKERYENGEYWAAYRTSLEGSNLSWRLQMKQLIHTLQLHRARLAPYPWQPSEQFFVEWAVHNFPQDIQQFVVWSLKHEYREKPDMEITIKWFASHLKAWADFFESPQAREYSRKHVPEKVFFIDQQGVGAPWLCHYFSSEHAHRYYAREMWKSFYNGLGHRAPHGFDKDGDSIMYDVSAPSYIEKDGERAVKRPRVGSYCSPAGGGGKRRRT